MGSGSIQLARIFGIRVGASPSWFVVLFVLWSIWPDITNGAIRTILCICGAGLLVLNTAAILAMLRHYESDKHFIYSLDLMHLDEMRRPKRV